MSGTESHEGALGEPELSRHLWGIAYRLTGSAADADDVVQETFARALASPRERSGDDGLRPWLVRIATNIGIDALRRRRRAPYVGPWLPEPIDTGDDAAEPPGAVAPDDAHARYDLLESVSFAFLVALEALTPRARAVLVLRDVLDYSVRETAHALSISEAAVKTTLHRARKVMETYDAARCVPTRALQEETRAVLQELVLRLTSGDVDAVAALLSDDVRTMSDSGGAYHAARVPVVGRAKVARFWVNVTPHRSVVASVRMLNGLPAIVAELGDPPRGVAPRTALLLRLGPAGLVEEVHGIVAPRKLARLFAG